jgi:hypothetical protein
MPVRRWTRPPALVVAAAASLALLGPAATPAPAQQRPLATEDPETIGAGHVLLEGGVTHARGLEIPVYGLEGDLWQVPSFGFSVGISSIAEFQVDAGYSRLHVTDRREAPLSPDLTFDGDETSTIDDIVLATKIRFLREGRRRPALAFRLATKLPNARTQSGLGTDLTDVSLSLLVAKTVGSVRVVGNVGVALIGDPTQPSVQSDPLVYGVSFARALSSRAEVVAEIAGRYQAYRETPPPAAENRARLLGGLRYTIGAARLDAALAAGLTGIDPPLTVTAGVTWAIDAFTLP